MAVPQVLYLDQNKWIDLATCLENPRRSKKRSDVAQGLIEAIRCREMIVPLTYGNLFETVKINDPRRRKLMAEVQSDFSRGLVFRGRASLLRGQLENALAEIFGLAMPTRASLWFLSDLFFESVADFDSGLLGPQFHEGIRDAVREDPAYAMYAYMMAPPDDRRRAMVRQHSEGSQQLILQIEARRASARTMRQSARKGAYTGQLLRGDVLALMQAGLRMGLSFASIEELPSDRIQALADGIPLYVVERELVAKVEGEDRPTHENDLRDIAAFDIVIPYADIVIGEKAFLNRARQARLGERFGTRLLTDFDALFG